MASSESKLFIHLFSKSLGAAQPESRFVFELLAASVARGSTDVDGYRVAALVQQYRLPAKLITDALDDLVRLGVVSRQRSSQGGKGRPAIVYLLSPAVIEETLAGGPVYGRNSGLFECLFSDADIAIEVPRVKSSAAPQREKQTKNGRPAPPGARKRLSACNRLLFATLLTRADHCGVVSGVGGPELRSLTGFDEASLKHRLRRLMDLGLIRRYVPGVSSAIFANSRVSSTYVLNLNPGSGLNSNSSVVVHLALRSNGRISTCIDTLRLDVEGYAPGNSRVARGAPTTPISVIRFLGGQQARVYAVLRTMLYRYASFLLSRHWAALTSGGYLQDNQLYEMIRLDFRKPVLTNASEGSTAQQSRIDSEWLEIIEHFYTLAHEIALEFRSRFGQANSLDFESTQMSMLPVVGHRDDKAIVMVMSPSLVGAKEFIWLREEVSGAVSLRPLLLESEVDLENRYELGLLTRPRRSPGAK